MRYYDEHERFNRTIDRVEARMEQKQNMERGYTHVASEEELEALENGTYPYALKEISKRGEIRVDENTKNPYIVYIGIRFDIEPIVEQVFDEVGKEIQTDSDRSG